jgi:hypothetical protein
VLASILVALAATPVLPAPATPAAPCDARAREDGWTAMRPGDSPRPVVSFAVAPTTPQVVYATDGVAVWATVDAGCTWRDALAGAPLPLPPLPLQATAREPLQVAVVETGRHVTAWVLSNVTANGVSRPEVLVSDATGSFGAVGETPGLTLPPGTGVALAAGRSGDDAYVLVDTAAGRRVLATSDRGLTWRPGDAAGGPGDVRALAVDPVSGALWAWGDRLLRSTDKGATFAPVPGVSGAVADVAVAYAPFASRVEALLADGTLLRSTDGGATWKDHGTQPRARAVAVPPALDVAAVAGAGFLRLVPEERGAFDVTPSGRGELSEVALARIPVAERAVRVVVARGADLLRLDLAATEPPPPPETPPSEVSLEPPVDTLRFDPLLLPQRQVVSLRAGETRTLPYVLDVPAAPSSLDVYFLVDTTGSMQLTIDSLRLALARIVNDLNAAGLDSRFGVGQFKEFPQSPWGSVGDEPYDLLRRIGPVDTELAAALARLVASGGGDGPESQFAALYEMARFEARLPSRIDTPEGPTGFRPDTLRVAVVATDTSSHVGGERDKESGNVYPGANYQQLVDALHRARVRTVGIAAGPPARDHLRAHALASGSVAPAGGVDCDGDGHADIPEGQPIVCDFNGVGGIGVTPGGAAPGIGSAIGSMLLALREPVNVRVASSDRSVAAVLDGVHEGVNVKHPNRLVQQVRFTCDSAHYGTRTPVAFTAEISGRTAARAAADVRCAAPVAPVVRRPVEQVFPPQPVRNVAAVAAVPPAPPVPVPNPQPNPQPNPHANPQPNPQLNPQPGAAVQEEQQVQLALAWDTVEDPQAGEELAMSRPDDPVPAATLLCAGVLTAGAAYGVQARRRTADVRVRSC